MEISGNSGSDLYETIDVLLSPTKWRSSGNSGSDLYETMDVLLSRTKWGSISNSGSDFYETIDVLLSPTKWGSFSNSGWDLYETMDKLLARRRRDPLTRVDLSVCTICILYIMCLYMRISVLDVCDKQRGEK